MPLTFPTMAEQARDEFRNSKVTMSIPTIAKRMGATVEKDYPVTRYIFDDDTTLEVTGAGRAHKMETFLP